MVLPPFFPLPKTKYDVTVDEIRAANMISSSNNFIQHHSTLRIPYSSLSPPPPLQVRQEGKNKGAISKAFLGQVGGEVDALEADYFLEEADWDLKKALHLLDFIYLFILFFSLSNSHFLSPDGKNQKNGENKMLPPSPSPLPPPLPLSECKQHEGVVEFPSPFHPLSPLNLLHKLMSVIFTFILFF